MGGMGGEVVGMGVFITGNCLCFFDAGGCSKDMCSACLKAHCKIKHQARSCSV